MRVKARGAYSLVARPEQSGPLGRPVGHRRGRSAGIMMGLAMLSVLVVVLRCVLCAHHVQTGAEA